VSTAAIQKYFERICFGRGEAAADGIPAEDLATLNPKRLALYRRLIRHNVIGVIETMLPNTQARARPLFDATVDAFLDEVGPRTAHLRDVPSEFLAYAAPRWQSDPDAPPWLADHATLELLEFTIGVAPRPLPPPPLAEVTAERALVFAETKALVRLNWAVNAMEGDAPEHRPVAILVYRDASHAARFLELTSLAASILERLFAGEPLGVAMTNACAAIDQDVLAGTARLLADLGERGVLLGARDA
jgi:hypothetical protein